MELGNRRPSQLMEPMLALLPTGEEDCILFKLLYVTKLPSKVRSQVLAPGINLSSMEKASLTDDLWFGMNQRHFGAKSRHMTAAVPEDDDELEEAVVVLNIQPKRPQPKKKAAEAGKLPGKLCRCHQKFGDQTRKCVDLLTCMWSGNE